MGMTERTFRLILGGTLLLILLSGRVELLYMYIGIVSLEGLTNWRIPVLISKLRYGQEHRDPSGHVTSKTKYPVDAERVLRLVIAAILMCSIILFPKTLWFVPWFVGFALTMAGMTGICPMCIFFKKLGFK
jgi:hypothetical protein